MTGRKILLLQVCSSLAGGIIFLAIMESVLAVADINTRSNTRFIPGMGNIHIPHSYYRHTKEGFSEGYFNSHGFRDHERTYAKPKNTFRILVLGDSYTEALQVALENAFPALLEKKLNEDARSIRFEVLNLGHSGFGTANAYMRYLNFGVKYSPDIVILAFLTGNDIRDNSKILNRAEVGFYFRLDDGGKVVLDRSLIEEYERTLTPTKRFFQFIKENSYLASLISERLYLMRFQLREKQFQNLLAGGGHQGSREKVDELSDLNIYLPDMGSLWKEAYAVTEALFLKFRKSVEENGGRFLLVTLSNGEQVHPEVQQELEERYGLSFDFEQPDRIIEEFAKKHDITHLKLMPTFREYHLRTRNYLHGFGGSGTGHWNENGHRLAAEKIFKFLKENDLIAASRDRSS